MNGKNCPFNSAILYMSWTYYNCDRCTKAGDPGEPDSSNCEIFEAIHDAAGGIDIPDEVAARFGLIDNTGKFSVYTNCPELEENP